MLLIRETSIAGCWAGFYQTAGHSVFPTNPAFLSCH